MEEEAAIWCYVKTTQNEPFCGVYMTDLIYHAETKASKIILRWRGENFRKDNIKNLKEQFKILKTKNQLLYVLVKILTMNMLDLKRLTGFSNLFSLRIQTVYRKKGARNKFINDVEKISTKN